MAEEVEAVRTAAGAYEIAQYARYEVRGPGAEAWLDRLVAGRIPPIGTIRLAPMLNEAGRLMGDLTVARLDDDRFWLTGSYYLQDWHARWFRAHMPPSGVTLTNITDAWMGFSISGPASRAILAELAHDDVSNEAFGFLRIRRMDVGTAQAVVGRISLTGELGYEIVVPANRHRTLLHELREAGAPAGLRLIGDRAIDSLRLEKGYGIWSAEFRQDYTPAMTRPRSLRRVRQGRVRRRRRRRAAHATKHRRNGWSCWRSMPPTPMPPRTKGSGSAIDGSGFVTSGAYGHHVGKSLALAYVERDVAESAPELTVFVVGEPRTARILPEIPYDPKGARLRDLAA